MLLFVVTCSALRPLFIPSRSEGPSAAQLSTSASTPTPVGYPLCFDNDPFCLSPNPFLLITIWIAYVWNFCSCRSMSPLFHALASLFRSLAESETHLPSFQQFAHSLPKTTGVYPHCSLSRGLLPRDPNGIRDRLPQNSRGSVGPSLAIFSSPG